MSTPRGVLFVGAHPDDETVMAGGMLALLAAQGVPAWVVCATDGGGGESGGVIEPGDPARLAQVRMEELRCAVARLGAGGPILLGYQDPLIGPDQELYGFDADDHTLADQVAAILRQTGADTVLTHGTNGEYGHPAHRQVHRAVLRAAQQAGGVIVYSVAAQLPGVEDRLLNRDDPAHLALDITPWIEAKHQAMLCHRTQHALFKRRRNLQTVREAIRIVESVRRQYPPVAPDEAPGDPFAALLRAAGAWSPVW